MKKLGKKKVVKEFPLTVEFLNDDGEKETLELTCKVRNPHQHTAYNKAIKDAGDDYVLAAKANCMLVTGWQNVVDADDKEIPFSQEEFIDLQLEEWGLIEAIFSTLTVELVEVRKKRLLT